MKISDIRRWAVFCNDIEGFIEFLAIEQGEHWLKTTNVIAFDFGKNDMKVVMYNNNINQKENGEKQVSPKGVKKAMVLCRFTGVHESYSNCKLLYD